MTILFESRHFPELRTDLGFAIPQLGLQAPCEAGSTKIIYFNWAKIVVVESSSLYNIFDIFDKANHNNIYITYLHMYKEMISDNIDTHSRKFDYLIPKPACPVRYQKVTFINITADMDEWSTKRSGFSFRLLG